MKIINLFFALVAASMVLTSVSSASEVYGKIKLNCNNESSLELCATKIEKSLADIGCDVDASATQCVYGLIPDPNSSNIDARIETDIPVCRLISSNCSSPNAGPWNEFCDSDQKMIEVDRKENIDSGFGYGIATIFFGYSRNICIAK